MLTTVHRSKFSGSNGLNDELYLTNDAEANVAHDNVPGDRLHLPLQAGLHLFACEFLDQRAQAHAMQLLLWSRWFYLACE